MAALSAERKASVQMGSRSVPEVLSIKIADNVKIYKGALVMLSGGYATPGATATGKQAIGRAEETVDNTIVGHSAGLFRVKVKPGVFKWNNSSAGDLIADTEVGTVCYIVDDNTVAKTNGTSTRSAAGIVIQVDADGVWVLSGPTQL